jgi:hypothetical protein
LTTPIDNGIIFCMRLQRLWDLTWRFFRLSLVILVGLTALTRSEIPPASPLEQIRAHTRQIEFDYVNWVLQAFGVKFQELALGTVHYFPEQEHPEFKMRYLGLVRDIQVLEAQLNRIYTDPAISDPAAASLDLRRQLDELDQQRRLLTPLAEAVMQRQVAAVAAEMGLTVAGQPVPPVLYKVTSLPMALVVSPRHTIRQDYNISLNPGISVDEQVQLESKVDTALDVSSLVVQIGGVGLYPTMVMETNNIVWLAEIVAHEWIHNYLTIRPLGASYLTSRELHVMNETAASIAGKEIGLRVIGKYYPEYLPPPQSPQDPSTRPPAEPAAFDFRAEMREIRVTVEALLEAGEIEEAEAYMEQRRRYLWENGYQIRKLNQAYFAFYGAYADQPGGAAGEDPVGEAVRNLRAQSDSLASFLRKIGWMWSFEQLQRAVAAESSATSELPR